MLLPILQDYLKKANEKESIVKSGDDLLKEIKVKEDNKVFYYLFYLTSKKGD